MKLHTGPTGALQAAGAVPTPVRKTVTFTGGAGAGAVGTVALFTVTGDVLLTDLRAKVTTTLADTVDGAFFSVGTATSVGAFFDAANELTDLDTFVAGKWLLDSTAGDFGSSLAYNETPPVGIDENIIITVSAQAINSGVIVFYLQYTPLSAGASVVAA